MEIFLFAFPIALGFTLAINILHVASRNRAQHALRGNGPTVSVLIPARNEIKRIEPLLKSLREQRYPILEIIVCDDDSTDGTAELVRKHAEQDPRIRIMRPASNPERWLGKSYACQELSREAKGDLFLFIDADIELTPDAIGWAIGLLEKDGTDALTAFPELYALGTAERASMSLVDFFLRTTLPLPLVRFVRHPLLSAGHGQFFLFRRKTYETVGGHANVRHTVVEDVAMSRLIKSHGMRVSVEAGLSFVGGRMYSSHSEVVAGLGRSGFAAANYRIARYIPVLSILALALLLPYAALPWTTTPLMLLIGARAAHAVYFKHSVFWSVVLHPLQVAYLFLIALYSALGIIKGTVEWKGRPVSPV